jgi:hypothetical protein
VQGFYNVVGPATVNGNPNHRAFLPALDSPLVVSGSFQMTAASQVCHEGLTILHFMLTGMESNGMGPKLLGEYMAGFLDQSSFDYIEVEINLATDSDVVAHEQHMTSIWKSIKCVFRPRNIAITHISRHHRILIFITTHSHEDTGDLFVSRTLCSPVDDVRITFSAFSQCLTVQFMASLLPTPKNVMPTNMVITMWILSCGALVAQPASYRSLLDTVKR